MGEIALRPVRLDADLALVHGWMQEPHVVPWWELAGPADGVRDYLAGRLALGHLACWIATDGAEPFAYVETYRAAEDELAAFFDAAPGDRGFHLLVGPPDALGTGAAQRLARHVLAYLWAQPGTTRVLCEPDERNTRMLAFCRGLGATEAGTLEQPGRRAVLMVWEEPLS